MKVLVKFIDEQWWALSESTFRDHEEAVKIDGSNYYKLMPIAAEYTDSLTDNDEVEGIIDATDKEFIVNEPKDDDEFVSCGCAPGDPCFC